MSREQLLDISARFLDWVSSRGKDPSELATIVAKDVVILTPFPGTTPDFAGLLAHQQKATIGSSDFKLTLKQAIVDEVKSTVVHFLQVAGTHDGEWMGMPPTGKQFCIYGFAMNKIDPARGLVVEHSTIFQDLSMLQQIGVIPNPSG